MKFRDLDGSFREYDSSLPLIVRIGCYGIVKNSEGKFLMIITNKNSGWEFAGGGCDAFETLRECVTREVKEETGFNANLISEEPLVVVENYAYSRSRKEYWKKIDFLYLCELQSQVQDELQLDTHFGEDVLEMRWMSIEELKSSEWIYFFNQYKEKIIQYLEHLE